MTAANLRDPPEGSSPGKARPGSSGVRRRWSRGGCGRCPPWAVPGARICALGARSHGCASSSIGGEKGELPPRFGGCWRLCRAAPAPQPPLAFGFAQRCVTAEPPSPVGPWGISRARKRRVTWRKRLLSNPDPPHKAPQTQNSFQACNQISILMRL